VDKPWWCEVDAKDLAAAMRHVVANPDEARERGGAASRRIRTEWTWARSASIAMGRMQTLAARPARLTACIILKDEEPSLPRCLESLQGLADEVIVVDTGSTDRSAEIALRYGAKVKSFPWSNDFSAARNEAMRHATGNWVLMIDADEWLEADGRREIRCIVNGEGRVPQLLRQVTRAAREPQGVEQLKVRLFPNSLGLKFAGAISETLVDVAGNRVSAQPTGVVLRHWGGRSGRRQRHGRVLKLLETAVDQQPENVALALDLCRAYLDLGLAANAEKSAQNAIDDVAGRPVMKNLLGAEAHELKARALLSLGKFAEAADESRIGISLNPTIAEAHATLAAALAAKQEFQPAADAYRAALQCLPVAGFRPVDREASGQRSRLALHAVEDRLADIVKNNPRQG
jgi:hypothetical protein